MLTFFKHPALEVLRQKDKQGEKIDKANKMQSIDR